MGLYLCVFASDKDDQDLDGVEVGSYEDFGSFRSAVAEYLEGGEWGSRFPVLMEHSDAEGEWSSAECQMLRRELADIASGLESLPPAPWAGWQREQAKLLGLEPESLLDTFIDVDGEPLVERLIGLAELAAAHGRSIAFQ